MARRALALLLLAAATGAGAAEDSLGTLFLSAAERARLDSLRRGDEAAAPAGSAARDPALTGFVQRSDGRTTVWIDGRAVRLPARRAPHLDPRIVQDDRAEGGVRVERTQTR